MKKSKKRQPSTAATYVSGIPRQRHWVYTSLGRSAPPPLESYRNMTLVDLVEGFRANPRLAELKRRISCAHSPLTHASLEPVVPLRVNMGAGDSQIEFTLGERFYEYVACTILDAGGSVLGCDFSKSPRSTPPSLREGQLDFLKSPRSKGGGPLLRWGGVQSDARIRGAGHMPVVPLQRCTVQGLCAARPTRLKARCFSGDRPWASPLMPTQPRCRPLVSTGCCARCQSAGRWGRRRSRPP